MNGGNREGKGQPLEELCFVSRQQFAGFLVESRRNSAFDLVRDADCGKGYGFPTEEVSGSVINGVDEILVGDRQFPIAPSRDDAVSSESVHRDGIRVFGLSLHAT